MTKKRRIGPYGTAARALGGLGLLFVAGSADGLPWDVGWYDPVVGLVALPGVVLALGFLARRRGLGPLRYTGPVAHVLNCALIVALLVNPYTAGGATLFYAATMLLAAWRGQPGCEVTLVSNAVLRRDDQVGCPLFFAIDAAESRPVAANE
jgi:hypothetical protein